MFDGNQPRLFSVLPFVREGLQRCFEEFPSGRTQRVIMFSGDGNLLAQVSADLRLWCNTMSRCSAVSQSDPTGHEHSQIRSPIPEQEEGAVNGGVESSGRSADGSLFTKIFTVTDINSTNDIFSLISDLVRFHRASFVALFEDHVRSFSY